MRIFINSVTAAVNMIISSWDAAVNSQWHVEQEVEYNTDPNKCPWVGIYSPRIVFDPERSNIISPFNAIYRIPVLIQTMDYKDVEQAILDLNTLSGEVYTAVSCYRDLMDTVNIVKTMELEPFNREIEDENVLVANRLTIIAEVFA